MKRQLLIVGIMIISLLLVTGCETNNNVINKKENMNTTSTSHDYCTRGGTVTDGEASFSYDLYYTGEVLNLLVAVETVTSSSTSVLDAYDEAYRNINIHYYGLDYYETEVIRTENSVSRKATINYDKINISKLLEIEGEEDNIIENGVAKVKLWKELAEKFGATCTTIQ